jgi:hypothetical protein
VHAIVKPTQKLWMSAGIERWKKGNKKELRK